jgi:hypothetical protein
MVGWGPWTGGGGVARARRTERSPHAGAARMALTAINRRRKNKTAQPRNTRDPERRYVRRARAPRARADQGPLASVADRTRAAVRARALECIAREEVGITVDTALSVKGVSQKAF